MDETFHGGENVLNSTAILTFVNKDGRQWVAGATLTRLRPKDAPWDGEVAVQLSVDNTPDWRLKEIRVVSP